MGRRRVGDAVGDLQSRVQELPLTLRLLLVWVPFQLAVEYAMPRLLSHVLVVGNGFVSELLAVVNAIEALSLQSKLLFLLVAVLVVQSLLFYVKFMWMEILMGGIRADIHYLVRNRTMTGDSPQRTDGGRNRRKNRDGQDHEQFVGDLSEKNGRVFTTGAGAGFGAVAGGVAGTIFGPSGIAGGLVLGAILGDEYELRKRRRIKQELEYGSERVDDDRTL